MSRPYGNVSIGGTEFKTLKDPAPQNPLQSDVVWRKTPGGKEIATKYSEPLKRLSCRLWLECGGSPDDLTAWESFIAGLSGMAETFAIIDQRGNSFTGRFLADPIPIDDDDDILIDINLIEVRS